MTANFDKTQSMTKINSSASSINKIYFPIVFLLSWLGFTIFVFSFGPYTYNITGAGYFYTYLLLIHLALFIGYKVGLKSHGRLLRFKVNYLKTIEGVIVLSACFNILKLMFNGGAVGNVIETFNDASLSYEKNITGHFASVFTYLDMIFYPIYVVAITNAITNYKNLRFQYRIFTVFLLMLPVFSSIGSATRSGIVQATMIIFSAILLSIYKRKIILTMRRKVIAILAIILAAIAFIAYNSLLVTSRGGISLYNLVTGDPPRDDFILNEFISPEFQLIIASISFYISHSYYRLNKAMDLPFEGLGLGFTNSVFIMSNIERLTGWNGLFEISYGIRLDREDGVGDFGLFWSTFYTWIASDFTFPGVIIIIFFIGYFFALSLKDSLLQDNPLSIATFCVLFYFIFHFSFNNPLQDGQGLATYFFLPLFWFFSRKKLY